MLCKAARQGVRHPNVQSAVSTARKDVDEILCHLLRLVVMDPRLREDDGISYFFCVPPPVNDFSRMPVSVALGVIASGSILR
jgi:hypothetical protein